MRNWYKVLSGFLKQFACFHRVDCENVRDWEGFGSGCASGWFFTPLHIFRPEMRESARWLSRNPLILLPGLSQDQPQPPTPKAYYPRSPLFSNWSGGVEPISGLRDRDPADRFWGFYVARDNIAHLGTSKPAAFQNLCGDGRNCIPNTRAI